MELTVLVVATVLTSRAVVVATLHPSCAAVVAQPQAVAELQAVAAAEVAVRAEKCLMYLEPTRLDQWLDQCCAAMQPSLDSSR
jgi:hypothetical protein